MHHDSKRDLCPGRGQVLVAVVAVCADLSIVPPATFAHVLSAKALHG